MIKFFRNIRRQLIEESKIQRYLLYAIGEILLVMIGILLALQVNNWNEQKQRKRQEIEYLRNFKNDLEIDVNRFDLTLSFMNRSKNSMSFLLDYIERDLPWHDSLQYHFGKAYSIWAGEINLNTYETVKSKDWNIISNLQIRKGLSDYYNWMTTTMANCRTRYEDVLIEISDNILRSRFDAWETNYEEWKQINTYEEYTFDPLKLIPTATPNDFEALKKDLEYIHSLKSLLHKYNFYRELQDENARLTALQLIDGIELELVRLGR